MAPRQLAAKGNEQWMCYLTAMTTKYPQSEGASRVGYCKMYVDSHRWALGGWSESHMHMSCSGYCTKATPEGSTFRGVHVKDFTYTGSIGPMNGGTENLPYCFLSYINIQLLSASNTTEKVGCKLTTVDNFWIMNITSPGNGKVACGVACTCTASTKQSVGIEDFVCIPMTT